LARGVNVQYAGKVRLAMVDAALSIVYAATGETRVASWLSMIGAGRRYSGLPADPDLGWSPASSAAPKSAQPGMSAGYAFAQ